MCSDAHHINLHLKTGERVTPLKHIDNEFWCFPLRYVKITIQQFHEMKLNVKYKQCLK